MVRFGSSVTDAAYSRLLGHWYMVNPVERIADPPLIWMDPEFARAHPSKNFSPKVEKPACIRRRKAEQLVLF
jgi:hypothetical protein